MTDAHAHPRRHRGRVGRVLALSVVLAVLTPVAALAASSTPSPAPTSSDATTLTVGITQDVDSLNPFVGILASSYELFQLSYDTLTNYSAKDFSPVPGLATSWKTSPDGLTWTFTIRTGVKWSDGVPLTAHDVAYTFNRVMNGSAEKTNYGNYVANLKSVTAPNNTTVVMTTKHPDPSMLHLSVYILPEHIWKHVSESQVNTFTNSKMVGSGPFILEQRVTGQFIKLRANPDYWGGAPHIKTLIFRVFDNNDAMVQALRKGEIDFADDLPGSLYKSLAGAANIKQVPAIYSGFDEIGMNTGAATTTGQPIGNGNPVLKDVRVRQAINYAIDRQVARQPGARRVRLGGVEHHPADLRQPALHADHGRDELRPGEGEPDPRRGGVQEGLARHPGRSQDRARRSRCGCSRDRTRSPPSSPCSSSPTGCRQSGSRSRSRCSPRTTSTRSSATASTTCSSSAGWSSPTPTTSCRP